MAQEVFWMAVVSSAQLKVTRREYYAQPSLRLARAGLPELRHFHIAVRLTSPAA
jgi:hypothetical protein